MLFELAVTKAWLRQVIVGLTLICHGSYRGVVEFLRDLLGVSISIGCVHNVLQAATRQAAIINLCISAGKGPRKNLPSQCSVALISAETHR